MDEATITSHIYDILTTNPEPMNASEIGREMRPEMSATEVNKLLNKVVTQYEGVGKGYQTGQFVKVGNRWTIKQFGMTKGKTTVAPESFLLAVI